MKPEEAIERLEYLESALDGYPPETGINDVFAAIDTAIKALEEIQQYRETGTVEECREAVEKQKAKKILPLTNGLLFDDGWRHKCPNCGCAVGENIYHPDVTKDYEYCSMCGQAIHE